MSIIYYGYKLGIVVSRANKPTLLHKRIVCVRRGTVERMQYTYVYRFL